MAHLYFLCPLPAPLPNNACRATFNALRSHTVRSYEGGTVAGQTKTQWDDFDAYGNPGTIIDRRMEPEIMTTLNSLLTIAALMPVLTPIFYPRLQKV